MKEGGLEKSEKWSKFGPKLDRFLSIRTICCKLEEHFSKIVN